MRGLLDEQCVEGDGVAVEDSDESSGMGRADRSSGPSAGGLLMLTDGTCDDNE